MQKLHRNLIDVRWARLDEAFRAASKQVPIVLDANIVYLHLSGSAIGPEPEDIDEDRTVPRSLLQNEVMCCIALFVAELRSHQTCIQTGVKIELGAFSTNRRAWEPKLDTRLVVAISYRELVREANEHICRYRYKVATESGSEIFLSGDFELCCEL